MQNKIKNVKNIFFFAFALVIVFNLPVMAEEDMSADKISADAISEYNVDGSVFQKITDLEQDKVLMQLEKEKAQLDLDLDRLASEKVKLQLEMDALSNNAEEQKQELANQKAELEAESARLEREKQSVVSQSNTVSRATIINTEKPNEQQPEEQQINEKYKLVDIIGAGNQLQATLEDLGNGQRKKISVGKVIDGYTIKSIALDDGVTFSKDDVTEILNISKTK